MRRWWPGSGRGRGGLRHQPVPGSTRAASRTRGGDTRNPGIPPHLGWVFRRFAALVAGRAPVRGAGTDPRFESGSAAYCGIAGLKPTNGLLRWPGSSAVTGCATSGTLTATGPARGPAASPGGPGHAGAAPARAAQFHRRASGASAHRSSVTRGCTGRSRGAGVLAAAGWRLRGCRVPGWRSCRGGRTRCRHRLRGGGGRATAAGTPAPTRGTRALLEYGASPPASNMTLQYASARIVRADRGDLSGADVLAGPLSATSSGIGPPFGGRRGLGGVPVTPVQPHRHPAISSLCPVPGSDRPATGRPAGSTTLALAAAAAAAEELFSPRSERGPAPCHPRCSGARSAGRIDIPVSS